MFGPFKKLSVDRRLFLLSLAGILSPVSSVLLTTQLLTPYALHAQSSSGHAQFVVTSKTTRYRNGTLTRTNIETEAFQADGSRVLLRNTSNSDEVNAKSISDVSSGKYTFVDPKTRSITTYKMSEGARLAAQANSCDLGISKELLGFTVYKSEVKLNGGPRSLSVEKWLAPALDCYPLEQHLDAFDEDGTVLHHDDTVVTFIQLGNPDPALFAIPADYTERSPSQWTAELAKEHNRECIQCNREGLAHSDQIYYKSR